MICCAALHCSKPIVPERREARLSPALLREMDTDASPTATAESGAGLISGEQQQQSADFAMDDKTVVIINIDPASGASEPAVSVAANVAGDGTGEEVVQTAVATSAMDGVDQAEVTIYPQQLYVLSIICCVLSIYYNCTYSWRSYKECTGMNLLSYFCIAVSAIRNHNCVAVFDFD